MIIIKKDISSIFPKTINKIIKNLETVNKFKNDISSVMNRLELTVFVRVKIESLKEFSKFKPPAVKILDKINILIKKLIKIKKDVFKLSLLILNSVLKILWSIIIFGVTNLKISSIDDFKSI